MADATLVTPAPKKRRGWLRAIAWVFGILIVLLVVVYFVATSSAFFKGVILPRAGKAMNALVTVSDASISPFSQVILHDLKVQPTGAEPLVTAAEVRLRYSLMDIIRGNIQVDEVALISPTVTLIKNPDGTSNMDPILKSQQQKAPEKQPAAPAKPSAAKPMQIDLKKFALTDATIRMVKNFANGTREVEELSHVNITLDDLKNGQTGKLALGADISVQLTNAALQAKLGGNFALALTADLKPSSIKGTTRLDVTKAEGALADAAGFGSDLNVEVTPSDIKEVALRFQKGDAHLGELTVSGPFDMPKTEGRLSIVLAGIDKRLLNLAGAKSGMDFGNTAISSTNAVELAKGGTVITAKGQFDISNFQLTRLGQTTPRLDLSNQYDVTVDRGQTNATLRALTVTGKQNGDVFLKAELTSPMKIPLGTSNITLVDALLPVAITNFNLADWKPFLGEVAPAGMLSTTATIQSRQADNQIAFALDSRIDHLTVNAGSNSIADMTITLHASGQTPDLNQFTFSDYKLQVARQNETLTTVSGSGTYDKTNEVADVKVTVQAALGPLLRSLPQPDMSISSGTVQLTAHLTRKQKTQAVTGNLALADFSGRFGKNEVRSLGTTADFDVGMTPQQVQIRKVVGKLSQGANAAGGLDLSGAFNPGTKDADLQANVQLALAPLFQAVPQPDMSVSAGTVELKTHITQKQKLQTVTGNLVLAGFTGKFGKNELRSYGATMDVDAGMTPQQVQVRKASGQLTQDGKRGGSFDLTATYDLTNKTANLNAKLVDFNQNGVGAFLEPMLADKKLVSVAINATATAQYDPQGASAVKAEMQMKNLVVNDPKGQFPATPLEARMQVDASVQKQVADVRQFQVTLTPTARATNQVQLTGQVDMSNTNAIQGNLKLAADSLDFTSYYDLFMGGKQAPEKGIAPETARAPAPTTAPGEANKEPDPITLPLSNFTAQASIRRLYLHEVEIADWQATTKIDGGHVVVNPFKLTLNGAPVNSTVDLDLGVRGWKYDLSLGALGIPLTPLVDTFQPERKGQIGGTTTAQGRISGAGITGASLQKNLNGQFDVNSTNLNLSVINIKSPLLKTLINVVAGIPELLRNPSGTVGSLLGGLAAKAGSSGGLADDLQRSPIDAIVLQGKAAAGRVDLQQATVQSSAFKADAGGGTITLAPVLTNSTIQIPVAVSLSQPIAQRLGLTPAGTPTNAAYAKLPDFLTMIGTVGAPKSKINYLALASVAGKSVTGAGVGVGGNVGAVLGNILGTTPAATTNQPATNQLPVNSLIKGLFGPKKK